MDPILFAIYNYVFTIMSLITGILLIVKMVNNMIIHLIRHIQMPSAHAHPVIAFAWKSVMKKKSSIYSRYRLDQMKEGMTSRVKLCSSGRNAEGSARIK